MLRVKWALSRRFNVVEQLLVIAFQSYKLILYIDNISYCNFNVGLTGFIYNEIWDW